MAFSLLQVIRDGKGERVFPVEFIFGPLELTIFCFTHYSMGAGLLFQIGLY